MSLTLGFDFTINIALLSIKLLSTEIHAAHFQKKCLIYKRQVEAVEELMQNTKTVSKQEASQQKVSSYEA